MNAVKYQFKLTSKQNKGNDMKKIIVSVLLISLAYFVVNDIYAETKSECKQLEKEIKGLFKECQSCNADNDCYLETEWYRGCPFGCNNILSSAKINDNEKIIKRKLKEYREKCPMCKYKCGTAPEANKIGCRNNKCVDLRYYKEDHKLENNS